MGAGGGGGQTTGYKYKGSLAIAVCIGRVDQLIEITNGDTVIWPLAAGSPAATPGGADDHGKTILTTTIGIVNFYWGTPTQDLDPALADLMVGDLGGPMDIPFPTLRNVCYAVCLDIVFGGQPTPPVLQFTFTRYTNGLSLSAPVIDVDLAIPEVIYDLLTNTLYGAGIDPAHIDAASFAAAGETTILEGYAASPFWDASMTIRELLGKLQQYFDAITYFDGITIRCDLIRYSDPASAPVVDESELLDEPTITDKSSDCRNKTVITFNDRDNKWEQTSEAFDHQAHAVVSGEVLREEYDLPFVTSRAVAKKLALLFGARAGQPRNGYTLRLGPSWTTLHPGSRLKVTYTKLGITAHLVMVTEVRRGGVTDPVIEVDCITDLTRGTENDYIPPEDNFTIPPTVDEDGQDPNVIPIVSTTPRLMPLPAFWLGTSLDGFLVAMDRPSTSVVGGQIWWTWDPAQRAYSQLMFIDQFPIAARVVWWHRSTRASSPATWLVRIELEHAWDVAALDALLDGSPGIYFVTGRRLIRVVTKDEHQTLGVWGLIADGGRNQPSGTLMYDLEVYAEQFGTDDFALEQSAADSTSPTASIYIGRIEQFAMLRSDILKFDLPGGNSLLDTEQKRYIKTPVRHWNASQSIADVTAATFDKDDTTMCPDGTLLPDWGPRSQPTYELLHSSALPRWTGAAEAPYGLQEIERNLLAGYLQSTCDTELLSDIDHVLGSVFLRNDQIYNDAI